MAQQQSTAPPQIPGLVYVRLLGSGGYSQVHLYQQQLPRRHVAVKVLKPAGMGDALRLQLTAEANAMAGLADHPNIVPVFAADITADGRPYIVMMYYPRANLGVRAAGQRFGVAETLRIGIQIASAIETAHRVGILHRDIKPANILTSQYGAPGLTDFGIAAQLASIDEDDDAGVSVPWSPPEVLYATAPASVRSDVYSLAATLWHLLVGRSPFEVVGGDNSPYALMRRIRDLEVPSTGRADVPDGLSRLLRQTMAKDPMNRPSSAMDLARALQSIEQQLALPRTEIVVLADDGGLDPATPAPAVPTTPGTPPADPTRLRSITPIAGQTVAPERNPWQPPAAGEAVTGTGPSPHTGAGAGQDLATNRRPDAFTAQGPVAGSAYASPAPGYATPPGFTGPPGSAPPHPHTGPPPAPEKEPSRRRVFATLVGAGIVAVLAAIGAIVIFGGNSGSPKPKDTLTNPVDSNAIDPPAAPGPPAITGVVAAGGKITFTWTYNEALPSDTYRWRVSTGTATGVAQDPTVTVAATGAQTCLEIQIIRADGSSATAEYSAPGCV